MSDSNDLKVPDEIFSAFASDPLGALDKVLRTANGPESPLRDSINDFLCTIPDEAVEKTRCDETFRFLYGTEDTDRLARIWFAEQYLIDYISKKRLMSIREGKTSARPLPYSIPALDGIEVDDEHLVPLTEFDFDGSRLTRNGHAFTVLSTTTSPNSTYWLLRALYFQGVAEHAKVRLDPFLWDLTEAFPSVFYKDFDYGQGMDWRRISQLRIEEHGRWRRDRFNKWSECTEFCWKPRETEVVFTCEEVPKMVHALRDGGRYFHAIYSKIDKRITHFDGALRIYTSEELSARQEQHLRKLGKEGEREKVFLIETPVPRECFRDITQAFFVWNGDLVDYFRNASVPQPSPVKRTRKRS